MNYRPEFSNTPPPFRNLLWSQLWQQRGQVHLGLGLVLSHREQIPLVGFNFVVGQTSSCVVSVRVWRRVESPTADEQYVNSHLGSTAL
jgi:hypothetical protein